MLFIWLALSLLARCCTGCILTHSQHVKTRLKTGADLNGAWSSRATLWQVFDEKQAEEIFKMLLVTPLCNALLWCCDMFWLEMLSCMSHMFYRCRTCRVDMAASIDPCSFFHSELAVAADQEHAAKTSLSRFWRTAEPSRDSVANSNRKCPRFKSL